MPTRRKAKAKKPAPVTVARRKREFSQDVKSKLAHLHNDIHHGVAQVEHFSVMESVGPDGKTYYNASISYVIDPVMQTKRFNRELGAFLSASKHGDPASQ